VTCVASQSRRGKVLRETYEGKKQGGVVQRIKEMFHDARSRNVKGGRRGKKRKKGKGREKIG